MIDAKGLRKTYPNRRGAPIEAVRGVDLTVGEGEIFGFLGPNGAGKTTTVRMLATLVRPTDGTATVAGHDLFTEAKQVRKRIGYVSQAGGVDENAPGRDGLVLAARLAGLDRKQAAARADELLATFNLADVAGRNARMLSGGQRRRLALAIGLVHEPPLVFLDEPTTGLDPQARANLWDEIRRLRDGGTSVFLTTHYLDEADALCDRIAIIDAGRIVAEGTPADLKRAVAGDVVTLRGPDRLRDVLRAQPYVRDLQDDGPSVRAYVDDGERVLPILLREFEAKGVTIDAISLERATLDDVFLRQTGRSLREEVA